MKSVSLTVASLAATIVFGVITMLSVFVLSLYVESVCAAIFAIGAVVSVFGK